jgi:tRNA pseudouridine55 synthase
MGEILERKTVDVEAEALRQASRTLLGVTAQIPPMVSALKQGGQRLYRLARRGVVVDREPRRIEVMEWEWLDFKLPEASFRIRCSSGTYVRTLVHDLGTRLGTGAALQSLRRLRSEPFGLEKAVSLRELGELVPEAVWARGGIALSDALAHVPSVRLDPHAASGVGHGATARVSRHTLGSEDQDDGRLAVSGGPRSVVLRDVAGAVLALGELKPDPEDEEYLLACPHVVFPWAVRVGRP